MVQLPTEFRATLEAYRGPLDLLLYLIKKDELDILDIPISRITQQYLLYLQILKSVDPNLCGEFLVLAAQLMEIKSRVLLPVEPLTGEDGEDLEDPRLELVLQLLEYKKYKERALILERMVDEQSRRYRRPSQGLADVVGDDVHLPLDLGSVSVWDLLTAFQRIELSLRLRTPHRVLFEDRPIEEYFKVIEDRLVEIETLATVEAVESVESVAAVEMAAGDDPEVLEAAETRAARASRPRLRFEEFFESCRNRHEAVSFLLALLELAKQGRLRFWQDDNFGPILVSRASPPAAAAHDEPLVPGEAPTASLHDSVDAAHDDTATDEDAVTDAATDTATDTDADTDADTATDTETAPPTAPLIAPPAAPAAIPPDDAPADDAPADDAPADHAPADDAPADDASADDAPARDARLPEDS